MPNQYTVKHVLKVLSNNGFFFVSQSGSHVKYRKNGNPILTVIIPIHGKEIRYGTFRSILQQANLIESDFKNFK
jgi:predicted RNA binding protein YcfA (HicA-like mRNA interferase family)